MSTDATQSAAAAEDAADPPREWLHLGRAGDLMVRASGQLNLMFAGGVRGTYAQRDRVILASRTRVHAWLLQAAAERNAAEDPVPGLLRTNIAGIVMQTMRTLVPSAFEGVVATPPPGPASFPSRPWLPPSILEAERDPIGRLTHQRMSHRAWADRMATYREEMQRAALAAREERAAILKAAQIAPGGPAAAVTATLDRVEWPAAQDVKLRRHTTCDWHADGALLQVSYHAATSRSTWTVAHQAGLPAGLARVDSSDGETLRRIRRHHAAALWVVLQMAFSLLPAGARVAWQSGHRIGVEVPVRISAATIGEAAFRADELGMAGALEGGSVEVPSWLHWRADSIG